MHSVGRNWAWQLAQLAELKWWQYYLKKQSSQDYKAYKLAYWSGFLQKLSINVSANAKVLDAGCGPAGIFMALSHAEVTAVDPLIEKYEAKLLHFNRAEYAHATFIQSSLEAYVKPSHFDYVFCINAINHVSNMQACLQNLRQSLARKGQLIISTDCHKRSWKKQLFRAIPLDILHPQQYDKQEYEYFLEQAGFRIESAECLKEESIFDYWVWVCTKSG